MWPIVRDALSDASPPIRRQIRWIVALWCGLVLLQMWDSRDAEGVAGVAEFLSAVLGSTGVALLVTIRIAFHAAPSTNRRSNTSQAHLVRFVSSVV